MVDSPHELFTAIAVSIVLAVTMTVTMVVFVIAMIVAWGIFLRPDEIDRPIARMIFMTVLAPVLRVSGWYVQINRRRRRWLRLDQHGLWIDDGRRRVAPKTHLPIDAWGHLPGENDVEIQIAGATYACARHQHRGQQAQSLSVHLKFLSFGNHRAKSVRARGVGAVGIASHFETQSANKKSTDRTSPLSAGVFAPKDIDVCPTSAFSDGYSPLSDRVIGIYSKR
jgi:hypothetical protein